MTFGQRWVVMQEVNRLRWGGDLRRHYLFAELARRTGATVVDGWSQGRLRPALARPRGRIWVRPARIATAELLQMDALELARREGIPTVLDVHDDPIGQREALGLVGGPEETAALRARRDANLAAFERLVVPSAPFAALLGLDPARTIVAPNGSDLSIVRPMPLPAEPAVGLISGAAPARGIEALIEAVRLVRGEVPGTRLLLWLAATGTGGEQYLAGLRAAVADDPWIEFGAAPYTQIGAQLARATVLVLPTPAHPYWDSVAPIKLFDCMAAGRAVVTTPRTEPARIVEAANAGRVARGDGPADLAEAIAPFLHSRAEAAAAGAAGRAYVEAGHDWRKISSDVADALLGRPA